MYRALIGMIVGCALAAAMIYGTAFHVWPWLGYYIPSPVFPAEEEPTSPAWEKAKPKLAEADRRSAWACERRLNELAKFFDEHRKGCRPFAESVLSLRGKWKLVTSSILMDDERARFLSTEFSRHVFTPKDLRTVQQSTVEGCLNELDAIEGQLLVDIRADLADDKVLSKKLKLDLQSDGAFRQTVKRIVKDLAPSLGIDLAVSGGSLAATMVGPGAAAIDAVSTIIVRVLAAVAAEAG